MSWRHLTGEDKATLFVGGVLMIVIIGFWATVIGIAWHFIAKFW